MEDAEKGMESFEERMATEQQSQQQRTEELQSRFSQVQDKVAEQSADFERGMAAAGKLLASLVAKDHYGMNQVVDQIDALTDKTTREVNDLTTSSQAALAAQLEEAKTEAGKVHAKAAATSKDVESFGQKMDAVEDSHEQTMTELEEQQEEFREQMMSKGRRFTGRVEQEAMERKNETAVLTKQANTTTTQLLHALDLVRRMAAKVTGRVDFQLGTLELDDQKMNRSLTDAESAAEYADADAIKKVKAKATRAWQEENAIKQWRKDETKRTREFRKLVERELGKLGEELDMSAVELAEEKAAEEYHVREALANLHDTLGDEVRDLSKTSHARLAALSQDTGAQIAELMKREGLSEQERAEALAKIKAEDELERDEQKKNKVTKLLLFVLFFRVHWCHLHLTCGGFATFSSYTAFARCG